MPTEERRDAALRAIYAPPVTLALTCDGQECTDPAYARQPVNLGEPQGDAVRYVANTELVRFGPWDYDAQLGFDGAVVYSGDAEVDRMKLDPPRRPFKSDEIVFRPGEIRLGML